MWGKLTGLAFIGAVLIWFLIRSIPTHAMMVRFNDPPPDRTPWLLLTIAGYADLLALIVIPIIAYRIFRRASRS
jgi:hypothetical protein